MLNEHLIGFSLSFCVKDILNGKIKKEDILIIQTSCSPGRSIDVDDIIDTYKKGYWNEFPLESINDIINWLLLHNKIAWTSPYRKNSIPIHWGHWLSINNVIKI